MKKNIVETIMGALVLIVAISFLLISYKSGNIATTNSGYKVFASFREVGTLSIGSDVRVGGIKVGSVTKQYLDNNYKAVVEFFIDESVKLPKDSVASVISDSLLGGKYISIDPGADDIYLSNGDKINYTQDAISIESLIGRFAFGSVENQESSLDSFNDPL
jgi:phospholipid/cholesterol/gamma-HCH transport system substrate-binding protein